MLYVVTKKRPEGYGWHVGQKMPTVNVEEVTEIQADGSELAFIIDRFSHRQQVTIPVAKTSMVSWYGDIARTIYLNLHY